MKGQCCALGDFEALLAFSVAEAPRGVRRAAFERRCAQRHRRFWRYRAGAPETLLTSDEMAERVGLKTRQSMHDGLKKGRIVCWRGARRGHVFPAGQLDSRSRPFGGLDRVARLFDDGYAARQDWRRTLNW